MGDSGFTARSQAADAGREPSTGSTRPSVRERFHRGEHLYATRTAECFKATDKAGGRKVNLWLLRFPLIAESEEASYFVRRLKRVSQLDFSKPQIVGGGVDNSGVAYLVTEPVNGISAIKAGGDSAQCLQWFIDIIRAVSILHQNGFFFGDVSQDTFVVNEKGKLLVVALMGTFEAAARQTAMLPPRETFHYVAPEQRSGSSPDMASDVYALGVYGYRLLTGRYLLANKPVAGTAESPVDIAAAPSALRPELPRWVDGILRKCLEMNPNDRFSDAGEILRVIEEAQRTGFIASITPGWKKQSVNLPVKRKRSQKLTQVVGRVALVPAKPAAAVPALRKESWLTTEQVRLLIIACAVVLGVVLAALLVYLLGLSGSGHEGRNASRKKESERSIGARLPEKDPVVRREAPDPRSLPVDSAPSDLKPLIVTLSAVGVPLEEKEQALEQISQSEDPTSYSWLIAIARVRLDPALRITAQHLLISRIKRMQLPFSAQFITQWFTAEHQAGRDPTMSPVYVLLLSACDSSRSLESRKNSLQQAYSISKVLTLQLTAALALDEPGEKFTPILRQLLMNDFPKEDLKGRGVGALLFISPSLRVFLSDDVPMVLRRFSDEDLKWALLNAKRGDVGIYGALAAEIIGRKMLSPYETVFLEAVVHRRASEVPEVLRKSLIQAAMGQIDEEQVDSFARWESPLSESLLYAVCVAAKDETVGQDAFDILAGKVLVMEPGASLVKWIKSNLWEYRSKLFKSLGILAFIDRASPADIDYAFNNLRPFLSGGLFRVLISSPNRELTREVVARFGGTMPSNELLPLLGHEDKRVRIAAVGALKGHNELIVLQAILRAYSKEQDPDVRESYRQFHWVTRERES